MENLKQAPTKPTHRSRKWTKRVFSLLLCCFFLFGGGGLEREVSMFHFFRPILKVCSIHCVPWFFIANLSWMLFPCLLLKRFKDICPPLSPPTMLYLSLLIGFSGGSLICLLLDRPLSFLTNHLSRNHAFTIECYYKYYFNSTQEKPFLKNARVMSWHKELSRLWKTNDKKKYDNVIKVGYQFTNASFIQ